MLGSFGNWIVLFHFQMMQTYTPPKIHETMEHGVVATIASLMPLIEVWGKLVNFTLYLFFYLFIIKKSNDIHL